MFTLDKLTNSDNFFLLAGPCVIEGEDMALRIAEKITEITTRLQIPYVFKGSYRKANRSRLDSFTGIGDEKALKILRKVGETFGVPTVTDIHETHEAAMAAEYVDVLQIPAFLCRQTDLLVAAARTGKVVNIKKGQFLSPGAMQFAAQKVVDAGNRQVMLTERGTTFGYTDLVVDYRGIPQMQAFGFPVVMDVTHGDGCNAFVATAQPDIGRNGRYAGPHRDDCQGSHCRRSRWLVHRNTSRTSSSQVGRREYAATRFIGRFAHAVGSHPRGY